MGDRSDIQAALAAKLATITTANGYATNVNTVYSDIIPMGLDLAEFEMPAIFLLAGPDEIKREMRCLRNQWTFEIQAWDEVEKADSVMDAFIADISKAMFAYLLTTASAAGVKYGLLGIFT